MITSFLVILHIVVCIALIIIVLLQAGKGAEIGASFGAGSSQTVFGAGGGKDFMHRVTVSAAIIFMLTSLTLAYFYGQPGASSIMPDTVAPAQEQTVDTSAPVTPSTDAAPEPVQQENQ